MIDTKSEKYELPLIRFSIVSCKNTFHPDEISSNEYLHQVLRTIYMDLKESKDRRKAEMANICDSLENVSRPVSIDLKERSTSKENLFSGIINAYTNEETCIEMRIWCSKKWYR